MYTVITTFEKFALFYCDGDIDLDLLTSNILDEDGNEISHETLQEIMLTYITFYERNECGMYTYTFEWDNHKYTFDSMERIPE